MVFLTQALVVTFVSNVCAASDTSNSFDFNSKKNSFSHTILSDNFYTNVRYRDHHFRGLQTEKTPSI